MGIGDMLADPGYSESGPTCRHGLLRCFACEHGLAPAKLPSKDEVRSAIRRAAAQMPMPMPMPSLEDQLREEHVAEIVKEIASLFPSFGIGSQVPRSQVFVRGLVPEKQ